MRTEIGTVAGITIPPTELEEREKHSGWITVFAVTESIEMMGSIELITDSVNLLPSQARYLASLLVKAAEKAEQEDSRRSERSKV